MDAVCAIRRGRGVIHQTDGDVGEGVQRRVRQ